MGFLRRHKEKSRGRKRAFLAGAICLWGGQHLMSYESVGELRGKISEVTSDFKKWVFRESPRFYFNSSDVVVFRDNSPHGMKAFARYDVEKTE